MYEEEHDPMAVDGLILQFDILLCHLNQLPGILDDVIVAVADLLRILVKLRDEDDCRSGRLQLEIETSTDPSRPRYCIVREQIEYLLHLNLDCPTKSSVLGISLQTLRRRMSEFNLSVRSAYSSISDTDLESNIKALKEAYPNSRNCIMDGLLRERGIHVTQCRLREAMHQVDSNGLLVRFADLIHCRRYYVSAPQKLWHIDGNLKLVR